MFIRAVWRVGRFADLPQHFRQMGAPASRLGEDGLGIRPGDFTAMTQGLFDLPRGRG